MHVYLGCVWVVIYVKYITYEGLLHNTLALDVDTVQEACVYSRVCDDVDNGLDNTCEVIRQETVLFSSPETDYIIYD